MNVSIEIPEEIAEEAKKRIMAGEELFDFVNDWVFSDLHAISEISDALAFELEDE